MDNRKEVGKGIIPPNEAVIAIILLVNLQRDRVEAVEEVRRRVNIGLQVL